MNERIKFFRQEDEYKNWTISTEFTIIDSEQCVCKAIVADTNQRVISVGHAHEERSSSQTSYVENCETSAIGRALAMMGIGIDASIASANEVTDAIAKQAATPKKATTKKAVTKSPTKSAPTERDPELMSKAIDYIKSQTDKAKAFKFFMDKKGDQLTEKQIEGIKKFVR